MGGIEHAILHLLYARFFHRALKDLGYINFKEPFSGLFCQGMVCHKTYLGPDGWLYPEETYKKGDKIYRISDKTPVKIGRSEKMSKSRKNIIDPLSIIIDLRRYLVMEKSAAPQELNMMFANVENNGAPWPYNQMDRLKWVDE